MPTVGRGRSISCTVGIFSHTAFGIMRFFTYSILTLNFFATHSAISVSGIFILHRSDPLLHVVPMLLYRNLCVISIGNCNFRRAHRLEHLRFNDLPAAVYQIVEHIGKYRRSGHIGFCFRIELWHCISISSQQSAIFFSIPQDSVHVKSNCVSILISLRYGSNC